eukprot:PLAT8492.1.p1 GENE.PLAT8492.1~~PLAT8492.1.p1  ORF type:complete len:278 (-),score=136.22 PLAT8492.1:219-1052(-)
MSAEIVTSSLNLMRRMPPADIEQNVSGLVNLVPDAMDELLQRIDQPLQVAVDAAGRKYLLCDYNRDGDSYRSPWSNAYDPPLADGFRPSEALRELEMTCNEVFDVYRELYFEGGVSSVYLWDLDGSSFAGCFLIKKEVAASRFVQEGYWDSIHVMEVHPTEDGQFQYRLTTTVMVSMVVLKDDVGRVNLSGSLTRQSKRTSAVTVDTPHVKSMGSLVEDAELAIRGSMDDLYIQKTRDVVHSIRRAHAGPRESADFVASLAAAVGAHGDKRRARLAS